MLRRYRFELILALLIVCALIATRFSFTERSSLILLPLFICPVYSIHIGFNFL